ncbi:MAG: insulinase family protein [Treponema sp.]|uniref:M16 family metallopeptidase n=1 Tax=Treponema sp. TaxID=166 RepID=UPI0025CD6BAC|nr:pitrilysin family protein [Treponema sp.]MBQ9281978.1 insulinase family protein [Treponema sp.]
MLKKRFLFVLVFACLFSVFCERTSIDGVYRYKLENGLELFVAENDSAPLAYIEIAVRAGAVTQTPETAGLFHLYEHMMFKGNAKYENQDAFTDAANEMGRIDENGSTGVDRVNYFFTVPSSQVRNGLEFWSYAIRTPKLNEGELENEKAVVLSEIGADFTDPAHIRSAALFKTMFPRSPWRLDPSGNPVVVRNATAETLRDIQKKYYVPANSAIFVGGDVRHDEVYQYVSEIYSDWKNPAEAVAFEEPESKKPLLRDKKLVFVNPGSSDGIIQISYYLRGPDGETDASDTYAADVWTALVNSPSGIFARTFISEPALEIPESDYIGASYPTRRASGLIGFYGAMLNVPKDEARDGNYGFGDFSVLPSNGLNPAEKADFFLSVLKQKAVPAMCDKSVFFKDKSVDFVIRQLEDGRIYELEEAESVLSSLSFFWSSCGSDYFFSYDDNIASVTEDDVIAFVQKYIQGKSGTLLVSVSPEIWSKYKNAFLSNGYEEIRAEQAFWQNDYAGN